MILVIPIFTHFLLFFFFQPQNIVLMGQFPNCEIKLCDLDVARVIQEDEDFKEIIGTPDYVGKVFYISHSGLKKAKKRAIFRS